MPLSFSRSSIATQIIVIAIAINALVFGAMALVASFFSGAAMFIMGVTAGLTNLGLLYLLVRRRLHPLRRLADSMHGIGAGDLTTTLTVARQEGTSHNEITLLSQEAGHMADR